MLRPYIARDLGLSLTQAGSLYSVQAIGALVGAVVNGQLADRFGRRRALMAVMVGYGLLLVSGSFVDQLRPGAAAARRDGLFHGVDVPDHRRALHRHLQPRACAAGWRASSWDRPGRRCRCSASSAPPSSRPGWTGTSCCGSARSRSCSPLFAPLVVPDDRRMIPIGGAPTTSTVAGKLPIGELFTPRLRPADDDADAARRAQLLRLPGVYRLGDDLSGNGARLRAPPTSARSSAGPRWRRSSAASSGAGSATASAAAPPPGASSSPPG